MVKHEGAYFLDHYLDDFIVLGAPQCAIRLNCSESATEGSCLGYAVYSMTATNILMLETNINMLWHKLPLLSTYMCLYLLRKQMGV